MSEIFFVCRECLCGEKIDEPDITLFPDGTRVEGICERCLEEYQHDTKWLDRHQTLRIPMPEELVHELDQFFAKK